MLLTEMNPSDRNSFLGVVNQQVCNLTPRDRISKIDRMRLRLVPAMRALEANFATGTAFPHFLSICDARLS